MSTESNKAVVRRYLEECWGQGNLDLVDECVAPDFRNYNSPFFPRGIEGRGRVRNLIGNVRSMIPDLWVRVEHLVAEDDKVAAAWTSGGTQKGRWDDAIPPTGLQVEWKGIDLYRLEGSKVVELKTVEDGLSLLHQVRALQTWNPTPPAVSPAPDPPGV